MQFFFCFLHYPLQYIAFLIPCYQLHTFFEIQGFILNPEGMSTKSVPSYCLKQ